MSIPIQVNPSLSSTTPTQQAQSAGVGPEAAMSKDPYALEQMRYPLTGIGDDISNYVVFYINLPTASKYIKSGGATVAGANSASTQNYDALVSQGGTYQPVTNGSNLGAAVALNGVITGATKGFTAATKTVIPSAIGAGVTQTLDLRPKLTRIAKTIALYMPDTVATTYEHDYSGISATDAYGDIARYAALGGSVTEVAKMAAATFNTAKNVVLGGGSKQFNKASTAELIGKIAEDSGVVGQGFTDLQVKSLGRAVNPHMEMLFRATKNRSYQLVFDLVPRSQAESVAIYNIIKTFKAFAAPEVSKENGGRYFIPPALWDMKFYFQNGENPTIARVSTCALTNINVDYNAAGQQFTTFDDGAPIAIKIQLAFTEVDIITRELIEAFGY